KRVSGVIRMTLRPTVEKSAEQIKALTLANELPLPDRVDVLTDALSDKKYRVTRRGRFIYAAKGLAGPWGDMVTHLSILLILLGAIVGSLGFIGTINIYEGDYSDTFYNWNSLQDEPFGFTFYVEKFSLQYYPVSLKVSVRDRQSGKKAADFDTREGAENRIPGTDFTVVPDKVDTAKHEAILKIFSGGRLIGVYNTAMPEGGPEAPTVFRYSFRVLSHGDAMPKSVSSTVQLIRNGRAVKSGIVEVNEPMSFEGLRIYQTAYERDASGRYFSGFQIVRDPGIPLVWSGFLLLMAGLFISFFVHHRQVWIFVADDSIHIGGTTKNDLSGFMREYGRVVKRFIEEVEPV
ncbi:MAG TPA: cytochrome c biogenesis protein ResB, partial [Nitrospirota bacterium]